MDAQSAKFEQRVQEQLSPGYDARAYHEVEDRVREAQKRRSYMRGRRHDERIVQILVDDLVRRVGVDSAIRRIKARKTTKARKTATARKTTKGPGRPKGLPYGEIDYRLLQLADALEEEWRGRLPSHDLPEKRALLMKVVVLCWDREMAKNFGVRFDSVGTLGSEPKAVVSRLLTRPPWKSMRPPAGGIEDTCWKDIIQDRPFPFGTRNGYWPRSQDWEAAHRLRPDVGLLPDIGAEKK